MLKATSPESIRYILRELGRRAGAEREWIARWRVEFYDRSVVLFPEPGANLQVRFPFCRSKPERLSELKDIPPRRYTWMENGPGRIADVPDDFVVPFEEPIGEWSPLFVPCGPGVIECRGDILTSSLWTMSRLEELVAGPSDIHGRFRAAESVAFRFGFLDRPIVDEYGMAFQQALVHLVPGWRPFGRRLRVKLSHDVDLTGFPRTLRSTLGHLYPRRLPGAFFRDVLSWMNLGSPAYLQSVQQTARISADHGLTSAFYWKASPRTVWDSGYDPEERPIRQMIEHLAEQGFEMGVHPGYGTFDNPIELEAEIEKLRRVLGTGPIGGRQHFLRWRPSTWLHWERAGLVYDSSVGFPDSMGFRAGTAIPYHPWSISEDRELAILEIPLIVMDCTPVEYMRLRPVDTLERVTGLIRRCQASGGVFTLLWHNSSVIERPYRVLYPRILGSFSSLQSYDWKADIPFWPVPQVQEGIDSAVQVTG
jgi:hypothetical protein